jgi:ABC-type transporter Mla maintaining outer membrane lipid asymmetry ATPase subunit MlaF
MSACWPHTDAIASACVAILNHVFFLDNLCTQLTALMGPSGSGKTTLMDILAGRKTLGSIEGEIRFNGVLPTKAFLRRYTVRACKAHGNLKCTACSFKQAAMHGFCCATLSVHRAT